MAESLPYDLRENIWIAIYSFLGDRKEATHGSVVSRISSTLKLSPESIEKEVYTMRDQKALRANMEGKMVVLTIRSYLLPPQRHSFEE